MPRTPDTAALKLLRAIFDLAEADVRPSLDLLGRLLDLDQARAKSLVAGLRRTGMVQRERLGLTMAGLAVATSLPAFQPMPMASALAIPTRILRVA